MYGCTLYTPAPQERTSTIPFSHSTCSLTKRLVLLAVLLLPVSFVSWFLIFFGFANFGILILFFLWKWYFKSRQVGICNFGGDRWIHIILFNAAQQHMAVNRKTIQQRKRSNTKRKDSHWKNTQIMHTMLKDIKPGRHSRSLLRKLKVTLTRARSIFPSDVASHTLKVLTTDTVTPIPQPWVHAPVLSPIVTGLTISSVAVTKSIKSGLPNNLYRIFLLSRSDVVRQATRKISFVMEATCKQNSENHV